MYSLRQAMYRALKISGNCASQSPAYSSPENASQIASTVRPGPNSTAIGNHDSRSSNATGFYRVYVKLSLMSPVVSPPYSRLGTYWLMTTVEATCQHYIPPSAIIGRNAQRPPYRASPLSRVHSGLSTCQPRLRYLDVGNKKTIQFNNLWLARTYRETKGPARIAILCLDPS